MQNVWLLWDAAPLGEGHWFVAKLLGHHSKWETRHHRIQSSAVTQKRQTYSWYSDLREILPPWGPHKKASESSGEVPGECPHREQGHFMEGVPPLRPLGSGIHSLLSKWSHLTSQWPRCFNWKARALVTSWAPSSSIKLCFLDSSHYSRSLKSSACYIFLPGIALI